MALLSAFLRGLRLRARVATAARMMKEFENTIMMLTP
jgi:hypothetical protein